MADFLRDGRCPRCQSEIIYTRESDAGILFRQSDVMMEFYLCSQCGYLETYLQDAETLRPGWQTLSGEAITAPSILPSEPNPIVAAAPIVPDPVEAMTPDERRYHEMLMGVVSDAPAATEQPEAPSSNPFDLSQKDQALYDSLFGAPLSPELNDMLDTQENPRVRPPEPVSEPAPEPEIEPPYAEENIPAHLRDYLLPALEEQRIHNESMQANAEKTADDDNSYQRFVRNRHHDNKTLFQPNSDKSQH